ncbi:MAG: hypothetical protein ACRET5_08615, partial [Steroidobacteraceae bacterium]
MVATMAVDDSTAWVRQRMSGELGTVTGAVPDGYSAYARILHPASTPDGWPVAWREVAKGTAKKVHPLVQWHALVGADDYLNLTDSRWRGGDPERGNLPPTLLRPLLRILAAHTGSPERCWFCVWEGYGWPGSYAEETLALPKREYVVFTGSLDELMATPWYAVYDQSPNLFWPDDRAWCVATEIDFDSTLVGG